MPSAGDTIRVSPADRGNPVMSPGCGQMPTGRILSVPTGHGKVCLIKEMTSSASPPVRP